MSDGAVRSCLGHIWHPFGAVQAVLGPVATITLAPAASGHGGVALLRQRSLRAAGPESPAGLSTGLNAGPGSPAAPSAGVDARWLGLNYLFFYAIMFVLHAKDYSVVPISPILLAAGGLAW